MSLEIRALRSEAAEITAQAKRKLDEATGADEARAKEIEAEFDRMMVDVDALEARADRYEKVAAREAAYNEIDTSRRGSESRSLGEDKSAETRAEEAFDAYIRGHELTKEQRSFMQTEKRVGQNVAEPTKGGYLVPASVADKIAIALSAGRPMLKADFVNYLRTGNGAGLNVPVLNNATQKGRRIAEGASANRNEVAFDQKALNPFKYTSDFIPISSELMLDSSFDVAGLVADQCGELIGRIVNEDLTKGTGTAMPFGVVPSAGVGLTGATTALIGADDLIDLTNSVGEQYHSGAKFMLNQDTLGKIRKIKNSQGDYIWQQGLGGLPNTIPGSLHS